MIYSDGLVQDCSDTIANALELLRSCAKSSISRSSSAWCMVIAIESMFLEKDKALLETFARGVLSFSKNMLSIAISLSLN